MKSIPYTLYQIVCIYLLRLGVDLLNDMQLVYKFFKIINYVEIFFVY